MTLLNKILIILGSMLLLAALGFIIYQQTQIANRQTAIETQMIAQKELADNIMRSQNQYATADQITKFITANNVNLKAIEDDLAKLDAKISSINVVSSHSSGQTGSNIPSTNTGNSNPNPINPANPDPFNYMKSEQKLTLNENFANVQVPIGEVGFSAWQKEPWSVNIKAREYKSVNVVGTDENERVYVYNKFSVVVDGKEHDIKVSKAETKQEYPEAKFSFFNPKIFFSTGGAINITKLPVQGSFNLGLSLGVISYGKSKINPDISILQVGAGYETASQRPSVVIKPINFNIGGIFPGKVVSNTYIGPSLQIDTIGNVYTGVGLSVGL